MRQERTYKTMPALSPTTTLRQQSTITATIQAEKLIEILQKHVLAGNKSKMSVTRIRAAEVLLARAVPTLSAVDQTLHQPDDALSEDEIMAKFAALIEAHPDLLQRMLAMQAKAKENPLQSVEASNLGAA